MGKCKILIMKDNKKIFKKTNLSFDTILVIQSLLDKLHRECERSFKGKLFTDVEVDIPSFR